MQDKEIYTVPALIENQSKQKFVNKKTPEEITALKEKYAVENAAKAQAKADKKAKFAEYNADKNMPVCEIRIPWCWVDEPSNGPIAGKHINLDTLKGQAHIEALEYQWRIDFAITQAGYAPSKIYRGPCKRKIVRT